MNMKTMYAIYTRGDGEIHETFDALDEAVTYCREYELTDDVYGIMKYSDDNGYFDLCLAEYTVDGENEKRN